MTNNSSNSFGWIIAIIAVVVLISTNPSEDRHVSEAKSVLKKYVSKKTSSEGGNLLGLGSIIGGIGNMVIDTQMDQFVKRKNYYIFSLTCIKYDNQEEVIGWGILGNVYISDKVELELEKIFNKGTDVLNGFNSNDKTSEMNHSSGKDYNSESNASQNDEYSYVDTPSQQEFKDNQSQSISSRSSGYYKVLANENRVFIYSSPDMSTRKNAYFDTPEKVYITEFVNGFGYMEFTNSENQTSTGWILSSDLIEEY